MCYAPEIVPREGEYHENRDVNRLIHKLQLLRSAIESMAGGLREHGLSAEAAEDPSILATRIERIAALVQQKILAERHAPSTNADDKQEVDWSEPSLEDEVETMDWLRRQNDLRSERMTRRIAEATASGLSAEEAFELAMEEEGLPIPLSDSDEQCDSASCEPWTESLPSHPFAEASERSLSFNHPAIAQAQAFLMNVMDLEQDDSKQSSFNSLLARASMDILGGLVCEHFFEGRDRKTGEVKWRGTSVGLVFGSNSQLRAISEVYASGDAQQAFVSQLAWPERKFGKLARRRATNFPLAPHVFRQRRKTWGASGKKGAAIPSHSNSGSCQTSWQGT